MRVEPYRDFVCALAALVGASLPMAVGAGEWSGHVGVEYRGFARAPLDPAPHQNYFSVSAQPEYRHKWDGGAQSITFVPFARLAPYDDERSHADIRELSWVKASPGYEWRIGVRKVFWGVTESQHLVDLINQTDLVENPDGEEKLGQPMINLALLGAQWGTLDLYMLTGFRERTFPGREGRLRTAPPVDTDRARYESSRERERLDLAARWHVSSGDWEIGVTQFAGTARDPRFLLEIDDGMPVLIPRYDLIRQTGVDLQATKGAWLWKLEAIRRSGQGAPFAASIAGVEYTISSALASGIDVGVLAEYLYDDRGAAAPTPFQDDAFAGLRLGFNDERSSEALLGVIVDRTSHARLITLEASRRVGRGAKLTLEVRAFGAIPVTDSLYSQRRDDYVQLQFVQYF